MKLYSIEYVAELLGVEVKKIASLDKKYNELMINYKKELSIDDKRLLNINPRKKVYGYTLKAIFAFAMILPESANIKSILNLVSDDMSFKNLINMKL